MTKTYSSLPILLACLLSGPMQAAEPTSTATVPTSKAAPLAAKPMPEAAPPATASTLEVAPAVTEPAPKSASAPKTKPTSQTAPAPAPETSLVDMVSALSQFLTEEEVQMVYDYLWDSSIASLKGSSEEITLPPELAFKLAILQRRIVKEGGHYLEGLALKMEKDLARWQENMNTPAPPAPYSLPTERDKATPAKP